MGDYDKISLMLFAVLSVVGIVLAALLIAFFGPLMGIIWLAIFVACYFKLTESRTVFTYLFILSAPSSINGLVAILIPTIASPFVAIFGIFISYFVLQGKQLLE